MLGNYFSPYKRADLKGGVGKEGSVKIPEFGEGESNSLFTENAVSVMPKLFIPWQTITAEKVQFC